jgi:hypothetical protein
MEDIAKAFGVPQAEAEAKMAVVKTGGRKGGGIMEDITKAFGVPQVEAVARMGAVKTGSGFEEDMAKFFGVPQMTQVGYSSGTRKLGGRKPSAYAMFVKQFAAKHPGPNLMKRAGEAWRSQK